jgi:hypothetical protein
VLDAQTVVGVFNSSAAAEQAKVALLDAGVPEARMALYGEAVRSGACVLSVFTRSEEEKQYVEQLLLRYAHQTTTPP